MARHRPASASSCSASSCAPSSSGTSPGRNSATHLWGYRSFENDEDSRNNIIVGLISNGEGWHNNHHADPRSARHGRRWWELDNTWLTIRFLAWLGLATDVVPPNARLAARFAASRLIKREMTDDPAEQNANS